LVALQGNVTTTANISGQFILGNGAFLTGISGTSTYGNANVADYLASGTNTANIVTTGNVQGAFVVGNGSALTNLPGANVTGAVAQATQAATANVANSVAGANVTGVVAQATQAATANVANSVAGANVSGTVSSATTAGTVTAAAQGNITSVGTLTALSVTGNIRTGNLEIIGGIVGSGASPAPYLSGFSSISTTGVSGNISASGNLLASGYVSAAGNVTADYFIGNGSQLTGLPAGYSNADVATYLASGTNTSNIVTTGNVQGAFVVGNGSALTNLPGANVTGAVAQPVSSNRTRRYFISAPPCCVRQQTLLESCMTHRT
jgi:hypothetical protein